MAKLTLYVLAAGMGSRYGGLKQVDQVGPSGEAIIDYSIFDALRSGFDRVVFVIRRDIEEEFKKHFIQKWEGRIEMGFVYQELDMLPEGFSVPEGRSKPWGTAHAILVGSGQVDSPFVVINADDFYGLSAYREMSRFLLEKHRGSGHTHFAMAGFALQNTLSRHGTVSRGICRTDENGYLTDIEEITNIGWMDNHIGYRDAEGNEINLRGEVPVSMNIWGFTPMIFPMLETEFIHFLEENAGNPKAEFFIPTLIREIIRKKEGTVQVLPATDRWFGVTYREDKPMVMAEIGKLTEAGIYPSNLFA